MSILDIFNSRGKKAQEGAISLINELQNTYGWGDCNFEIKGIGNLTIGGFNEADEDTSIPAVIWWDLDGQTILTMKEKTLTKDYRDIKWSDFKWGKNGRELVLKIKEQYFKGEFYTQSDKGYYSDKTHTKG